MVIEALHSSYQKNPVVHGLVDYLSNRPKSQQITIVERAMVNLKGAGMRVRRTDVMHAFRALEAAGCGKLVIGRNTEKTRFIWATKTKGLAQQAAQEIVVPGEAMGTQEIEVANVKLIIPTSLQKQDVGRLIEAVRSVMTNGKA